jgi:probable rRNA maturation factor
MPASPPPQELPNLAALPQQDVAPASARDLAEQPVAAAGEAAAGGIEADSVPRPAVQRRGTGRTKATVEVAESPVAVNVLVPRGLGRKVDSKLIQRVVQLALQREGWSHPATLDVVLVGDDEMREINVTRRGIDEATDVLSFPLLELRPGAALAEDFFVLPPESALHLGDVVIAYSRVEAQALEAGHSKERELAFLTVHAVLHILGYDHDTEPRRRQMRRREEDVLIELGLRRNGHRSAE